MGVDGRVYTIKDEYGQGSGKITIQPQTGVLIDVQKIMAYAQKHSGLMMLQTLLNNLHPIAMLMRLKGK